MTRTVWLCATLPFLLPLLYVQLVGDGTVKVFCNKGHITTTSGHNVGAIRKSHVFYFS
jgi:hypothetical protein